MKKCFYTLVKSQIKKVDLEPFTNINSLCGPEAFWEAVPQARFIKTES